MRTLTLVLALTGPPDRWLGVDKMKHFLMSALVQSAAVSAARTAGVDRTASQLIGGTVTLGVGIGREIHDRRSGKGFSAKDLFWDVGGGLAAASLLNGAR